MDWTQIILACITLLGTIATGIIAVYTRQIHTAVNSERTATLNEIRELKEVILKLSVDKAEQQPR